ncbi:hypothetical protein HCN56_22655, partial [Streptomyces lonarensis]|nr:hypothetical protein [Streptomyces lonarensis]
MDEEPTNPAAAQPRDAIDVDDLVFAATGRRLRRLTLPDGSHWFPVTDLGVTECDSAASRGVPGARRDTLANLTGRFGVAAATGPGWTGTTELVDLSVVMMLALAGGTGAGADPFRIWVADVLTAVQRDGCHFLDEATVQPRGEEPGTGYAMPSRLAEAVVRLEESSVPQDAAFAEEPATGTAAADGSRNGEPHQDPRPDLRPSAAGGDFADPAESRATPASAAAGPPADRPPDPRSRVVAVEVEEERQQHQGYRADHHA